jgi:stage V sporulation protein G
MEEYKVEITEVRVRPMEEREGRLKAYATLTFDNEFVIRDVKVIDGKKGLFVAMPSRRVREKCLECGFENEIRSKFCNKCGKEIPVSVATESDTAPKSEHRDLAHPITSECRDYIQEKVLEAYKAEISRSEPTS